MWKSFTYTLKLCKWLTLAKHRVTNKNKVGYHLGNTKSLKERKVGVCEEIFSWMWWCTPGIPALGMLR
jgi:hypothetical protein